MLGALKSELRKIWTVRSTYIVLLFAVVIIGFFAFYAEGFRAGRDSGPVDNPLKLVNLLTAAIANLGVFGALVGILSLTHEYRYNTIMYTLTSSKSRTRSLLAKVGAVSIFSVFFTIFVSLLATAAMYLGLAMQGFSLAPQTFPLETIWQVVLVGWGYGMFALIIATLVRHQAGAIAAFFLIPTLVEQLAGIFLKHNVQYLPFTALSQVAVPHVDGVGRAIGDHVVLSPDKSALVVLLYVAVGWLIAWYLFLRRDAN